MGPKTIQFTDDQAIDAVDGIMAFDKGSDSGLDPEQDGLYSRLCEWAQQLTIGETPSHNGERIIRKLLVQRLQPGSPYGTEDALEILRWANESGILPRWY